MKWLKSLSENLKNNWALSNLYFEKLQ
jgi:hypothetical protein